MTALCFIAVVIFGIFSFSKLPIDLMPDIETNTVMIITSYSGASASDIENNVSRPLENTLNSVEHLKHIKSNSKENISIITLEFEYGYDIDDLTNDVRDKLDMVTSMLPDGVIRRLAHSTLISPSPLSLCVSQMTLYTPVPLFILRHIASS